MNGAEHAAAATELLRLAAEDIHYSVWNRARERNKSAQAHATLALAFATAGRWTDEPVPAVQRSSL